MFNFLFAILAYWVVFIVGVTGLKPVVGQITPDSPAARAGLEQGDVITAVGGEQTQTWKDVVLALLDKALDGGTVAISVNDPSHGPRELNLNMHREMGQLNQGNLLSNLGFRPAQPDILSVIDHAEPGSPAEQAGLKAGDRIISVDHQPVRDWESFAGYIRKHPGQKVLMEINRDGAVQGIEVVPSLVHTKEGDIGRIGAAVRIPDDFDKRYFTVVRYSPLAAFKPSLQKTWEMSALTLKMVGKMLVGDVSTKNLSGPLSIAQFAGSSANAGTAAFLSFLAIISVSLGVLNFLPIPVLDGGHLLYYVIEFLKGSPVSDDVQAFGQKLGLMVIIGLMVIAFYNDIIRLLNS